jgi:FlaA1/EpsC-like NDP-sugar epimerase
LRPGEKLHEELLVAAGSTGTEHPRIMQAIEPFLPESVLQRELQLLESALERGELDSMFGILARTVEGYQPSSVAGLAAMAGDPRPPPTLH